MYHYNFYILNICEIKVYNRYNRIQKKKYYFYDEIRVQIRNFKCYTFNRETDSLIVYKSEVIEW